MAKKKTTSTAKNKTYQELIQEAFDVIVQIEKRLYAKIDKEAENVIQSKKFYVTDFKLNFSQQKGKVVNALRQMIEIPNKLPEAIRKAKEFSKQKEIVDF